MVFKLIRIDTTNPLKIQLNPGNHRLGRGADLFECEDKRVSRKHGELNVTDDTVVLKSLHSNPCFYTKKHLAETQILTVNTDVELANGDKFGLLPDMYWYELIHSTETGPIVVAPSAKNNTKAVTNETNNGTDDTNKVTDDTNNVIVATNNITDVTNMSTQETNANTSMAEDVITDEVAQAFQESLDETVSDLDIGGSQSLLPLAHSSQTDTQEYKADSTNQQQSDSNTVGTPIKRELDSTEDSSEDVKRVKTESEIKSEGGHNSSSDVNPDHQSPQQGSSHNQVPPNQNQAPPNQNPTHRERCMYGAQCYRRNPQHKAQFSHPGDGDWGSGVQIPCPWGSGCTRTDPRHFRDHSHPDNMQGPQRRGKAKRPRKKVESESDDSGREVSPVPDLNLPAKRVRKTVKRQSWSGDESENGDPFLTDGSDDWTPSGKDVGDDF